MRFLATLFLCVFLTLPAQTATGQDSAPDLLLRVDDIGATHAINTATQELAETGIPFSVSVMPATPWFEEAVDILNDHPQLSVGIHLTLNSEWKGYRWGPVLGKEAVPSLVDETGYFHPSTDAFLDNNPDLGEVERELAAQIERALDAGLKVDYLDYHMGTAVSTPELRAVVERLADRYELGISEYFGEHYESMWGVPIEAKKDAFLDHVDNELDPDAPNLVVIHVAKNTPEMRLIDMNAPSQNTEDGEPLVQKHRQAELDMLLSEAFAQRIEDGHFNLITYTDVTERMGLEAMERPED